MPMNKSTVVEIPQNADERVVRIQLEEIAKAVKQGRTMRKDRVRVTAEGSDDRLMRR
jgi:hypothetical protein